jgi:hypothetical protein
MTWPVGQGPFLRDRDHRGVRRLLLHRVDEARGEDVHLVEAAFEEAVDEHLDRADQALELRMVAVVGDLRDDLAAHAVDEAEALVADRAVLGLDALLQPVLVLVQHQAQQVRVQAAAQALVGRDHDHADALHFAAPREQRMLVFRVGACRVHRDVEQALRIRAPAPHAFLRLLHLRGSDHFHRLRDLARVLHALDLEADFLGSGHGLSVPVRRVVQDGLSTRRSS